MSTETSVGAVGQLERVGELLRTQDNRATLCPIFVVEQKRYVYGLRKDYSDKVVWCDPEGDSRGSTEPVRGWRRVRVQPYWEFVTACFTEQGCKDYLAINGHNLGETRIYAYSAWRNREWEAVRDLLRAGAAIAKATTEATDAG